MSRPERINCGCWVKKDDQGKICYTVPCKLHREPKASAKARRNAQAPR